MDNEIGNWGYMGVLHTNLMVLVSFHDYGTFDAWNRFQSGNDDCRGPSIPSPWALSFVFLHPIILIDPRMNPVSASFCMFFFSFSSVHPKP